MKLFKRWPHLGSAVSSLLRFQLKLLRIVIYSIVGILVASCVAPTQKIQQSRDLSTSGIAYTRAVDSLIRSTTDRIIEFDSTLAIKVRRGQEQQLRAILQTLNTDLTAIIVELNEFEQQNNLLQMYFLNLQALADSPVQQEFGGALSELSKSISELNASLENKFTLSSEQQSNIGSLAGLVGKSVQAKKLKIAMERDSEVIGTQLALQEQQLEVIAGILQDRFAADNDLFYREKVENPYADVGGQPKLGSTWIESRNQYIRTQFTHEQLKTAQSAAKQLRGIWTDIVQGQDDIGALKLLISDVDEFVVAVETLKESLNNN